MNTNHTPTQRLGPLSYKAALAAQLRAEARIAELEAALRDLAAQCATVARLESCGETKFLNGIADAMIRVVAKGQA